MGRHIGIEDRAARIGADLALEAGVRRVGTVFARASPPPSNSPMTSTLPTCLPPDPRRRCACLFLS